MARGTEIKCNLCGCIKQETNHWLVCVIVQPSHEEPAGAIAFAGADYPTVIEPDVKVEDLCGEGCANKRLSQWLAAYKLQSTKESGQ